jgi:hypothetical protein
MCQSISHTGLVKQVCLQGTVPNGSFNSQKIRSQFLKFPASLYLDAHQALNWLLDDSVGKYDEVFVHGDFNLSPVKIKTEFSPLNLSIPAEWPTTVNNTHVDDVALAMGNWTPFKPVVWNSDNTFSHFQISTIFKSSELCEEFSGRNDDNCGRGRNVPLVSSRPMHAPLGPQIQKHVVDSKNKSRLAKPLQCSNDSDTNSKPASDVRKLKKAALPTSTPESRTIVKPVVASMTQRSQHARNP